MKNQTRSILTIATLVLATAGSKLFNFFYSPISGVATANALKDDTVVGYGMAKFVREGYVGTAIWLVVVAILIALWAKPLYTATSSETSK